MKGSAELEQVMQLLEFEYEDAQTLNGFMLDQMGKIPYVNEEFMYDNYIFKVKKATKKMVIEVEVKKRDAS